MIVDLERNDLGRVCRFGSVQVAESLAVESLRACPSPGRDRGRQACAPMSGRSTWFAPCSPAGRSPGRPRSARWRSSMSLEPNRRGVYTGAVGYWRRGGGTSEFNIVIRTLTVEGDRVTYQVGGGIVADSTPEAEYQPKRCKRVSVSGRPLKAGTRMSHCSGSAGRVVAGRVSGDPGRTIEPGNMDWVCLRPAGPGRVSRCSCSMAIASRMIRVRPGFGLSRSNRTLSPTDQGGCRPEGLRE